MALSFKTDASTIFNLATSIVGLFGETSGKDTLAVFNEDFEQVFVDARPMRCSVKEGAMMMQHPVETGQVITDFRIIQPVEVDLTLITARGQEKAVYTEIKQLYLSAKKLTLQSKVATFTNLYVSDMPHRQESDMFDAIQISLKLKEVRFVEPQYSTLPPAKVKDKKDSSTVKRGTQTAKPPTEAQKEKSESILFGLFN